MLSTGHIWLIGILLIVVLIIWGPGKLPDVGAGLGRAINEFRRASTHTRDEFNKATQTTETTTTTVPVTPAPVAPVPAASATPLPVAVPVPVPATNEHVAGEGDHQNPS